MKKDQGFEPGDLVRPAADVTNGVGIVLGYKFAHGPRVHWLSTTNHLDKVLVPSRSGGMIRDHVDGVLRPAVLGLGLGEIPYELSDEAAALQMKARMGHGLQI